MKKTNFCSPKKNTNNFNIFTNILITVKIVITKCYQGQLSHRTKKQYIKNEAERQNQHFVKMSFRVSKGFLLAHTFLCQI